VKAPLLHSSSSLRIDPAALCARVSSLPVLPQAVIEALRALRSDQASADDCAERISRDQALTARTLRLANSAFYGMPGRVATIRHAHDVLGRRTLGALLTTAAVSTQFSHCSGPGFDFESFWRHALGTAVAAQALALETGADDEQAFIAGLLHDIGRLALAAYFAESLAGAVQFARARDMPLVLAERQLLGVDHAEVGAMIAAHWHFPIVVVAAILDHHGPGQRGAASAPTSVSTLTELVHLADAIVHALDLNGADDEAVPTLSAAAWDHLGLAPTQVLRVFERTETGVAALSDALSVQARR
jgi:putative nucleotidyltransferase with HDIG domain